jgi:cytochrome c-type biogenesis protein CcmH
MGWVVLLAIIALSLTLLSWQGVRGGLLTASAAALLVGASGYALQGRPGLPGAPRVADEKRDAFPLTDARHAFFGHFAPTEGWLRISEALARDGKGEDSVGILQNAVKRYPGDPQLWIGLGNALVDHAHGLTPAAEFAYRRAAELAPGHPAPRFFYDLAVLRSGGGEASLRDLAAMMRENPDASWRPIVGPTVLAAVVNSSRATR